jgi:F0F1-type ATP synthase assembly protein I
MFGFLPLPPRFTTGQALFIMFIVPLCSIAITWLLQPYSVALASILGGMTYIAYTPLMIWWFKKYKKKTEQAP